MSAVRCHTRPHHAPRTICLCMNLCMNSPPAAGDWGFFSAYLVGGISFVVLGIGSINPGILQFAIDRFSQVYPGGWQGAHGGVGDVPGG